METFKKHLENGMLSISIGYFDIYTSIDDRLWLKSLFSKLFNKIGQKIYFFLMREEDLTERDELRKTMLNVQTKFYESGRFEYLDKLDERRFSAVAMTELDLTTAQFLIEVWKCFYAVDFFVPINSLTFEEYKEYIDINKTEDLYGKNLLKDGLCDFVCMKGIVLITSIFRIIVE